MMGWLLLGIKIPSGNLIMSPIACDFEMRFWRAPANKREAPSSPPAIGRLKTDDEEYALPGSSSSAALRFI